jgi:hypothetical protein
MAVSQHSFRPTATVSPTAVTTVASLPTNFADIENTFSNWTLSARDLLRFPQRLVTQFDRLLLEAPRQLLWTGARVAGNGAMAEAAQAPAGQPAGAVLGWRRAFGEAFQLSNTRSYWGMLHYVTSRWAFITFSLVSTDWYIDDKGDWADSWANSLTGLLGADPESYHGLRFH